MATDTLKYFEKYKKKLQVAILNNEDTEYLEEILIYVNTYSRRIKSLLDYIKDTKENYIIHYQASRPMPVLKSSTIGTKLIYEKELYAKK